MTEKHNNIKERAKEYSSLTAEIANTIRDLFPEAVDEEIWQQKEYEISDNLLITLGYDGVNQEAVLIVEQGDKLGNEVKIYNIKEQVVKKEGFIAPPISHDGNVLQYTDSEKTRAEALDNNPNTLFKPSLRIGLNELRIVSEIVNDPARNFELTRELFPLPRS